MLSVRVVGENFSNAFHRGPHFGFDEEVRWRSIFHSKVWRIQLVVALLLLVLIFGLPAGAQETTAAIVGTVTDAQAGVLAGAAITVTNVETGFVRTFVTEADGRYRISGLLPGNYNLKAELKGFSTVDVKGITLVIGQELTQDVGLKVGVVQQEVTVTAAAPIVDTSTSEIGAGMVQRQQVDSLPITQRTGELLALIEPATTTDVGRSSRPSAALGAGTISPAGTNYLLDGLSNLISGNGDPRDIVQEAEIQEFKVILNQTEAEYGMRASGVVTVASKSGTNQFHGEGFEFFRDRYINVLDPLSQALHNSNPTAYPIEPFSRNQYGGAIGGPILKDKLHFFFSYEHLDDQEYETVGPGALKNPAITAEYAPLEGSFRGGALFTEYFGKLDWQINQKNTAWLRFSEQNPATNYAANGGNAAAFYSSDSSVMGWTWAAGDTWSISPSLVNQFAAQVAESFQLSLDPKFGTPPQFVNGSVIVKFPNLDWGFSPGTFFHPFYQELRDDLTKVKSKHTFKFGGDLLNLPRNQHAVADPLGTWTFKDDYVPTAASPTFNPENPNFDWSTLATADPILFTATDPTIDWQDESLMIGIYAQDEWKVRPNLTLNLGLRYDLQLGIWRNHLTEADYPAPGLPPFIQLGGHHDYDNFAPRIGFAWDPSGGGKTSIRGGFGITNVILQDNALQGEVYTLRQASISIANPTWPNPYPGGETIQQYIANNTAPPNVTVNGNNVVNPKSYSYSLGFTRQLTSDLALSVEGNYTHIYDWDVSQDVNTPTVSGTTLVYPYPAYGQINETSPLGVYNYKGVYARLEKRYRQRYQYLVSYTLAKQDDNYGNSSSSAPVLTNYLNPSADFGPAEFDRRHTLVVSGSGLLWHGITLGGIWSLRSALPFSAFAGTDLNHDGQLTDYVPGTTKVFDGANDLTIINAWRALQVSTKNPNGLAPIPRSQIESNRVNQLDIRVSKDIPIHERFTIQLIGQLFNVIGTTEYGGIATTQQENASTGSGTSSGTFGTFSAALPRQQGELAVRFIF